MSLINFERKEGESNKGTLKRAFGEILMGLAGANNWSQVDLAKAIATTQPRVSDLYKGHFERFSSDWLFERLCMLGYIPVLSFDANKGWHGGEISIQLRNKGEQFVLPEVGSDETQP